MLTRSIRCHTLSEDIGDLTLESHSLEKPAQDEVQIAIHACAVNFPDILMAQGRYQFKPPLPFAPGAEFSGVITDMGQAVQGLQVGDRVVAAGRFGGFSEAVNINQEAVRTLPQHVSFAKAASYSTAYLTA